MLALPWLTNPPDRSRDITMKLRRPLGHARSSALGGSESMTRVRGTPLLGVTHASGVQVMAKPKNREH